MRARLIASILTAAVVAGCSGADDGPDMAVAGAPCPTMTAAQFTALTRTPDEESAAGAAVVRRQYGRATCEASGSSGSGGTDGRARCDMNNPGVVQVTVGGRDSYFDVPASQPATVTVAAGEVRCVVTARQP